MLSDLEKGSAATRTFSCTEENLPDFKAAVAAWPELRSLAKSLHTQGLINGLRDVRISITGSPELLAKGLGAIPLIVGVQTPAAAQEQPHEA